MFIALRVPENPMERPNGQSKWVHRIAREKGAWGLGFVILNRLPLYIASLKGHNHSIRGVDADPTSDF